MNLKIFRGSPQDVTNGVQKWLDYEERNYGEDAITINAVGQSQNNNHMTMSVFYTRKK